MRGKTLPPAKFSSFGKKAHLACLGEHEKAQISCKCNKTVQIKSISVWIKYPAPSGKTSKLHLHNARDISQTHYPREPNSHLSRWPEAKLLVRHRRSTARRFAPINPHRQSLTRRYPTVYPHARARRRPSAPAARAQLLRQLSPDS